MFVLQQPRHIPTLREIVVGGAVGKFSVPQTRHTMTIGFP